MSASASVAWRCPWWLHHIHEAAVPFIALSNSLPPESCLQPSRCRPYSLIYSIEAFLAEQRTDEGSAAAQAQRIRYTDAAAARSFLPQGQRAPPAAIASAAASAKSRPLLGSLFSAANATFCYKCNKKTKPPSAFRPVEPPSLFGVEFCCLSSFRPVFLSSCCRKEGSDLPFRRSSALPPTVAREGPMPVLVCWLF